MRKVFIKFLSREAHSHYANSCNFAQGYLVRSTPLRTIMAYPWSERYTLVRDAVTNCIRITSWKQCEEAAKEQEKLLRQQLGTRASLENTPGSPPGCYSQVPGWDIHGADKERELRFNYQGSSTKTCNNYDICICHKPHVPLSG